ncbi:MAG TPA: 1-acyl-sn-glycerol-3-phosphate acyltransferase [Flavobacterium sp.]|jgi:1-acyl-sn-glycerol-3-phosphate acyltransferase|uniref:1-acyl-sn-glycerol-3-phosphate acyltransferase n=1 Tax=Flavobacterium sp. TaxID=239 RepID=UPI002C880839|nr:1-acyl-sn-glycerol-3-phosphate acyltransferase [Flavobacterium sp.]MCA0350105.1 1-acyl-sn-glycerol-3-phosphate acyltransferase [Bacteroidota bacterium]HPW98739.1 1-acyl-sn-glycerol-3-phosphate acyltransferase [Flavobacterium sp.]HQA74240.1 1-acyl-sn-glycerol-3-phosphate acyltransferase [Flavobacterium sp.]
MRKLLYKFIFFKLLGWKISGTIDEKVTKCILMVMPHTSNFDFFIGIFTRGIMNMEMNFVAKKELFVFPFGYYFKNVGGAALDRSGGKNLVDTIVDIFNSRKVFRLAIAPEGTRKKVTELKTGFYYIALKANVPIIPVAFDYGKKEVKIGTPFHPTGNYDQDIKELAIFFKDVKGKNPEKQIEL